MARPRSYHRLALALVVATAAGSSAGCERRTRPPDDTLVVLIDTIIETSDPRFCLNNYETKLSRLVAPGLTTVDTTSLAEEPMLAESWEMTDPLTWDFVLKPGLKFSDGSPVTAEDVAWTFMSVIEPDSPSVSASQFRERFKSVVAVDERRVRFHLQKPLATMLGDAEFGVLSRKAARADGSFPGGRVVGAGPYKVMSLDQRRIVLERNPHYFGTPAKMPRLDLRVVRDAGARNLMLVGGSADLAQNAVRLDLIDDVVRRGKLSVSSGKSALLTYLALNNEDKILKDVRVRQAIALAIDRPAIIGAKYSGRATPATGLIPPGHWAYEPDVPRWERDLPRARRLLDEAGYPDPDGPEGPRARLALTFKISSDQFRVALARVIASQLGDVGISVDVRVFEFGTFFADVKAGSYQLASMQTVDITDPDYYRTYFSSTRIPTPQDKNANNRWRYRNARVDELTEQGRRVLDRAGRIAIYSEVQKIVAEEVPMVFLWHEDNVVITHASVTGYPILPVARLAGLASAVKPHTEPTD
jgi:peptide/nickel transport system substrate-binding protein